MMTQDLSIFEGNIPKPGMGEEIELYESEEEHDEDDKKRVHDLRPAPTLPVPVTPAKTRAASAKEGRNDGEVLFRPQGSLTTAVTEPTARMRNEARRLEIETSYVDMEILDDNTQMETAMTEVETINGTTV
jgi:hypothetical protein